MNRALFSILLAFILLVAGCAKIVTPVGGPKDITPPSVTKEHPANGSTHFKGNSFKVSFNEYVTLNNTLENVLISPPPATQPTYTLSGKTLIVKFQDTLLPDQTYNISFANCIQDFTEGNPLPLYSYAFSTGAAVDSMMVEGKVVDAQTMQPAKNCFVFAYTDDVDSLPMTTRPQFITKTLANGTFQIKNLKAGSYKVFVLDDEDNNLMYSQPTEAVAFSPVLFEAVPIQKDTSAAADTLPVDSVQVVPADTAKPQPLLRLFTAKVPQKMVKSQNKEKGKYEFVFSEQIGDVGLQAIDTASDFFTYFGHDTLVLYMKQELTDTLRLVCTMGDTLVDTLELLPFKEKETRGLRRNRDEKSAGLGVTVSNKGELYQPLTLNFSYPVQPCDSVQARLVAKRKYLGNDTTYLWLSIPDTFAMSLSIPATYEEKVPYELMIRDSVFKAYNGCSNDTIVATFTTKTEKDYGTLKMLYKVPANGMNYVATLLTEKGVELRSDKVTSNMTVVYDRLPAGKYKVRLLEDANGNGIWDTGDYRQKLLPEKVSFFPRSLSIRGYWELEESFEWKDE